jgi:heat shock protein HspQ
MKTNCQKNLIEIKQLISQLSNQQFTQQSNLLSKATIGQHVRHILEFYQSVLTNLNAEIINYDNRKRDFLIETNIDFAIQTIDFLHYKLAAEIKDSQRILKGNFSVFEGKETLIKTTLFRELAYCLEHSIHHQALIKVGLLELNCNSFINENFGLAPATIRYKKTYV